MKYLWCCRNLNEKLVCITSIKPNWSNWNDSIWGTKGKKQWLFLDGKFWASIHIDVFKKLIGISIKEGKEGLQKIPIDKMDLILKLKE